MAQEELKVLVKVILDEAKQKMVQFSQTIQNLKKNYLAVSFAVKDFYAVLKKVGSFVWDFVEAGMEAEKSQRMLQSALRASGQEFLKNSEYLNSYADAAAKTSFFDDEEIKDAMATLTTIGRVSAAGMKDIIPVVKDFAAAMGMDLGSAADLVSKALAGNVGALGRYGIKIKDTGSEVGNFNLIIKQMGEQFAGADAALAKTTAGSVKQFKENISEIKETIGGVLATLLNPMMGGLSSEMGLQQVFSIKPSDVKSFSEATDNLRLLREEYKKLQEIDKSYAGQKTSPVHVRMAKIQNLIEGYKRSMGALTKAEVERSRVAKVIVDEDKSAAIAFSTKAFLDQAFVLENLTADTNELAAANDYLQKVLTPSGAGAYIENAEAAAQLNAEIYDMKDAMDRLQEQGMMPVGDEFLDNWEKLRSANAEFISQLETEDSAIKNLSASLEDMVKQLASDAFLGTFDALGEALGSGGNAAESMREAMNNMLADFMKQLPRLLFQAGIMQLSQGNTPLGLALLAASGISAFVGGAMRGATGATGTQGPEQVSDVSGNMTVIVQGNLVTENDVVRDVERGRARW